MKPQRRRVLEKLIITEISGVDNPCQDPALVAIMKRTPQSKFEIAKLRFTDACAKANPYHDRRGRFTTRRKAQVTIDPFKRLGVSDFEDTANEIAKRDIAHERKRWLRPAKKIRKALTLFKRLR